MFLANDNLVRHLEKMDADQTAIALIYVDVDHG
jgi:hypothetical protein